jgi:hypothetical protein
MKIKTIIFLIILIVSSIIFIIEYGNYFLAINTFNAEQVSLNLADMNCLLNNPIDNIINDLKSLINLTEIKEGCNLFYTKLSYIRNLLIYINIIYILIILFY